MEVKNVMVHQVEVLSLDAPLQAVQAKMQGLGLDPLPVADQGKLVGMITSRRLQEKAAQIGPSAGTVPLKEAMLPLVTVREDVATEDAVSYLSRGPGVTLPGLLVVDGQGNLVGVVSALDLQTGAEVLPRVTGTRAACEPIASIRIDPVDHDSEESFPASDPPPGPSSLGGTDSRPDE